MKPLEWVEQALRYSPEEVSLPEELDGAAMIDLAEARSRLVAISKTTNELRRRVDEALSSELVGGGLRYGDYFYRPPSGRGSPKLIVQAYEWWSYVVDAMTKSMDPMLLLASLYTANDVKVSGLPALAKAAGVSVEIIKDTFFAYEPATQLSVMPMTKAPKWAQRMKDGQFSAWRKYDDESQMAE